MIWKKARESAFNYYKTFPFFVPQLLSTKEPIKIGVHVYPFLTIFGPNQVIIVDNFQYVTADF